MNLTVQRSELSDTVVACSSKFLTQVACAAAFNASRKVIIEAPLLSKETTLLAGALEAFGGEVRKSSERWVIFPPQEAKSSGLSFHLKSSGSATALLAGVTFTEKRPILLIGNQNLCARPMRPLLSYLRAIGIDIYSVKETDSPPFIIFNSAPVGGRVKFSRDGWRYFGAVALAAPLTEKGVELVIAPRATQVSPILNLMKAVGIKLKKSGGKVRIYSQDYRSFTYEVPSDISLTAPFFLSQVISGREVRIRAKALLPRDLVFLSLLKKFGVNWEQKKHWIYVWCRRLKGSKVNISYIPELFPFLAVVACFANGRSEIAGAEEARKMKSDRIAAMTIELKKMGAQVMEQPGGILVLGPSTLHGSRVESHEDPAVAAALVVAGFRADGTTSIAGGADALSLSYSRAITTLKELGAKLTIQD